MTTLPVGRSTALNEQPREAYCSAVQLRAYTLTGSEEGWRIRRRPHHGSDFWAFRCWTTSEGTGVLAVLSV